MRGLEPLSSVRSVDCRTVEAYEYHKNISTLGLTDSYASVKTVDCRTDEVSEQLKKTSTVSEQGEKLHLVDGRLCYSVECIHLDIYTHKNAPAQPVNCQEPMKGNASMDSVPQIFRFEHDETSTEIRTMLHHGEPYFVAADICNALRLENVSRATSTLDEDEKTHLTLSNIRGEMRSTLCLTEPGLYHLVSKSEKPEAKVFQRWINHEVLPSIRKTGSYTIHQQSQSMTSLNIHYILSGSTPEDIQRDQAILALLQQADTLSSGGHATHEQPLRPRKTKKSAHIIDLAPIQQRSLEEKILTYITHHQDSTDTNHFPTVRNLLRYIKVPKETLTNALESLVTTGMIAVTQAGKARVYRLVA